jgi:hypothetical protein
MAAVRRPHHQADMQSETQSGFTGFGAPLLATKSEIPAAVGTGVNPRLSSSEALEPAVTDLDDPAPCLLLRIRPPASRLLPAIDDVRDAAVLLDDLCAGSASVSRIGAQVLAACCRRCATMASNTASSRAMSVMLALYDDLDDETISASQRTPPGTRTQRPDSPGEGAADHR